MSQGKEWNKNEVIDLLKPYFQAGCNLTKACEYAGISQSTVQTWVEKDDTLRLKIDNWKNELNFKARNNWGNSINDGNVDKSIEWLKRKEKDEFGDRQVVELEDNRIKIDI